MIISRRWLSQYIPLQLDDDALNQALTFSGIEVEAVRHIPALPPEVVSARILKAEHLQGSEHLSICLVDVGDGAPPRQVVCGAPNCRKGMVGVLALPGAVLGELKIKSARLRGVESHGMLCSERELGISEDHAGIIELPAETPLGISVNELYELPDTIFELEITPNRPDLLGYLGIARDLSANLGLPLSFETPAILAGKQGADMNLALRIDEARLCPRYTARLIDGVRVEESPLWLKRALIKSGLRPINNVVDITNFVMLETGHPLHAFDYRVLASEHDHDGYPSIIVRRAFVDEPFLALDGKDYLLEATDLVIADGIKASALAGVIGGKKSAIVDDTSQVVLESAAFEPGTVRRSSYNHKISTDSSYRFERHQSPEMAALASFRATELIHTVTGGMPIGDLIDAYPGKVSEMLLALRASRFELLIGYQMPHEQIVEYLQKLGLKYVRNGLWQEQPLTDAKDIPPPVSDAEAALWFVIPPWRVDLLREADLIEELARLDGYDKVPVRTPPSVIMDRHAYRIKNAVGDYLVSLGFFETLSYSFNDPADLELLGIDPDLDTQKLLNPQSGNQGLMRISLLPQLLAHIRYNLNHGERDLKLMEISRIYPADKDFEPLRCTALLTGNVASAHWQAATRHISFFDVKGIVEGLLSLLGLRADRVEPADQPWLLKSNNLSWYFQDQPLVQIGSFDPQRADSFGIDLSLLNQELWMMDIDLQGLIDASRMHNTVFQPLPRFPSVQRDLSFLVSNEIGWQQISSLIYGVDSQLIQNVEVFDEYRGKQVPQGFRSLSIRILLQDAEKTLTDNRIDTLIGSVIKTLSTEYKIQLR